MTGSIFLDDIEAHLTAQGVAGGATGWTVKKTYAGDDPNKQVVLAQGPGEQPESDSSDVNEQEYPGLIVRVIGDEFGAEAAHVKAREVFEALHNSQPTSEYTYVFATGSPHDVGYTANNQPIVAVNFRCMRDR